MLNAYSNLLYAHSKYFGNNISMNPLFLCPIWRIFLLLYTVKKASRNSDVDNGGANQTTWGLENSYYHVVWFCATVVSS
jgi:hypothetical protein